MAELELNKIIGMIMENPELVEKIKSMSKEADMTEKKDDEKADNVVVSDKLPSPRRSKRNELLRALESFLSEDRRRSIETMITIADVLDTVKKV